MVRWFEVLTIAGRTLQLAKQASTPPTWQESAIAGAIIATTVNKAAVNLNCIYCD